ncbi:hypothetical protein O988_05814 [Pseudogymnoascus sp. VKM F-3808]|nr:hypothetical protein O988_05814 [Pseudogymnoascus sp. VKM F-3808]
MGISAEAIIGLVALFVTFPPSALLIYSWASRRQRSNQEIGSAPERSLVPRRGSFRSIPEYAMAGISPQDGETALWNYGPYPGALPDFLEATPHGADAPPWIADCNRDANKTASLAAQVQQDVCVKETRNITADAVGISGTSD